MENSSPFVGFSLLNNPPLNVRMTHISSAALAQVAAKFAHFVRTCRCEAAACDPNCTDTAVETDSVLPVEKQNQLKIMKYSAESIN